MIAGKDKGKSGTVDSVLPKESKAIIGGLNIQKRHKKTRRQGVASSIIDIAAPIHVSNLKLEKSK